MTCIVGLIEGGVIWMGGDSAGVEGLDLQIRADAKVFHVNSRFLIGYTSSFRMGQLLRFGFNPKEQNSKTSDYEYMCTDFIDAVRERFKAGGYLTIKNSVESGGCFLVGYKGKIYQIDEDLQVGERIDGFDAVGCGESYALGVLFATRKLNNPRRRVLLALEAAERFSAGVRRPFVIRSLKS